MAKVLYNFNGKKPKQNNLLGEIVQLFDTKGQEIKQKQADAQLEAIKLAQMQLNQPSTIPAWVYVVAVVMVIGILLGLYFAFRSKK